MNHGKAIYIVQASIFAGIAVLCGNGCCTSHKAAASTGVAESPPANEAPATTQPTTATGNETVIPLYKEDMVVGKREVDSGTVHVRKVVHTETVSQPIELTSESFSIQRQPVTSTTQTTPNAQAFQEQDFTIQLKKEEPVVETRVVQTEQVIAQKVSQPQTQTIQRQIRKEDVVVDKGNAQEVQQGAASSPGAQSTGAASDRVTDLDAIQAGDMSSLYGRPVMLDGVQVKEVLNSNLISVTGLGGQVTAYAHLQTPIEGLKAGDKIDLNGVLQDPAKVPGVTSGLSTEASQALKARPIVVEAKSAVPSGK